MSWSLKTRRSSSQEESWAESGRGHCKGRSTEMGRRRSREVGWSRVGGGEEVRAGRSPRRWSLGVLLDQGGQLELDLSAMKDS